MKNLNGDSCSRALKMAGALEKVVIADLLRPHANTVEKFFPLPATPADVENWEYPFFGMYRLILSDEISPELFELFSLLAYITNSFDFDAFKTEYYRLFGIKPIAFNPSMRFAGRIAQMWHQSTPAERRKLLDQWQSLVPQLKKSVTYSFFPVSTFYTLENASDPTQRPDFINNLVEKLQMRNAIPAGTSVVHKRIQDEDWFWFILCAQNGKVCMSCCSHPGVVVYNRSHGMLRTSSIKRDVHHLSCVIESFGTAYFGDRTAFGSMNKKLMKYFNLWGIQRLIGEQEGPGRPELISMSYSTYDIADTFIKCGNGRDGVRTLSESEEVGYVGRAHFKMSMLDTKEQVCRKEFTVYAGNTIAFERGCEENRILDWLVKMKVAKVGMERDTDPIYCGDIAKRVKWMENAGLLNKPCALWQFREIFGDYFPRIEKHLFQVKGLKKISHYRERNGASMSVVGGIAEGQALWEGRVGETDYIPFDEKELVLYQLKTSGQLIAKALVKTIPPGTPNKTVKKCGTNTDGADKDEIIREIKKRMEQGMTCNAACEAVRQKLNLSIDAKSLARSFRRWMKERG